MGDFISCRLAVLLLLLGSLGGVPAYAAGQCRGDSLRCWYILGGNGNAPKRLAFLARKLPPSADGIRAVEYVQVIEDAGFPEDYSAWKLRVDCAKRRFTVDKQYAGRRSGTTVSEQPYFSGWQEMSQGKFAEGLAYPFACGKPETPGGFDSQGIYFTDAYRTPDIVDFFKKVTWGGLDAE